MVMRTDEVLESRRTNGKVGATSSAREVRILDEENFESDDKTERHQEKMKTFFSRSAENGFWTNMALRN